MNPLRENPFNCRLAQGVTRVGFRKWYERELLSSHAHLVLVLLALFAMLAALEAFTEATPGEKLAAVSGVITLWALRRYLYLLMRAEYLAQQASCPVCKDYGRFQLVTEDRPTHQTQVRCRKCAHDWTILEE
jgi:Zn ribbon nucleic-acid-binding protein